MFRTCSGEINLFKLWIYKDTFNCVKASINQSCKDIAWIINLRSISLRLVLVKHRFEVCISMDL